MDDFWKENFRDKLIRRIESEMMYFAERYCYNPRTVVIWDRYKIFLGNVKEIEGLKVIWTRKPEVVEIYWGELMAKKDWEIQKDFFRTQYEFDKLLFGEEFAEEQYKLNKEIVLEDDKDGIWIYG